ncbi:TatD family deoxyribonuclease [Vibrio sp. OCN044]|uniref:TatD family deoxyribonuclease n=1 Tax=Vibrio tetraodonis subsp. pristinus TaxID=2695891 RepID=A0A6L8LU33_9VIBR|nr:TatD family hydrolase [Vibrio tetraodonis]MYM59597.1 TatD family deoxyribonuclease [Vibrio tetraodonis subsp. pristinus]
MRLFDTHCHFDFDVFADDFSCQLELAQTQGVERIMIPSIGPSNWDKLLAMSTEHAGIYTALGMHPYFLTDNSVYHLTDLQKQTEAHLNHFRAIGECGLDAMVDVDHDIQGKVFNAQIALANDLQLPLILHSRKTHNEVLQLLKMHKFAFGGVLHGFSGSYQQAMQFIELGFYIGIGGVITYPRARKTRQAAANLPLEWIVLETDAPDMPLMGYQGKPNHPAMLSQVLSCLALLRGTDERSVAQMTWKNANLVFKVCE